MFKDMFHHLRESGDKVMLEVIRHMLERTRKLTSIWDRDLRFAVRFLYSRLTVCQQQVLSRRFLASLTGNQRTLLKQYVNTK